MKVFDLLCGRGHKFEGWFATEEDYQAQLEHALLVCPVCGGLEISKVMSTPRLQRKSNQKLAGSLPKQTQMQAGTDVVPTGPQVMQMTQAKLEHELLNYIMKNTEDVGTQFAEEVRKMHYGETDERSIRGRATQDEAVELQEEGIDVVPLPFSPPAKNKLQ
jgi:Uncharacterized protein conserved in bacteria